MMMIRVHDEAITCERVNMGCGSACEPTPAALPPKKTMNGSWSDKRRSLLRRLLRLLVPCLPATDTTRPLPHPSPPPPPPEKTSHPHLPLPPSPSPPPSPPPPSPPSPPPSPPVKTLPVSQSDGVTSAAVVPPGSTGNDLHSRASTVPSSATTDAEDDDFTDDDIDDLPDDDPDELILLNGGAGIPVGPVSHIPNTPSLSLFLITPLGWCPQTPLTSHRSPARRQKMPHS